MSNAEDHAGTRRDFLYYATAGAGTVAAGAAIWPLVNQMNPSADVRALSTIRVDVGGISEGSQITVKWLGKPVFIRNRTQAEIEQDGSQTVEAVKRETEEEQDEGSDERSPTVAPPAFLPATSSVRCPSR